MNRQQRRAAQKKGEPAMNPNEVRKLQAYQQIQQKDILKRILFWGMVRSGILIAASIAFLLARYVL